MSARWGEPISCHGDGRGYSAQWFAPYLACSGVNKVAVADPHSR